MLISNSRNWEITNIHLNLITVIVTIQDFVYHFFLSSDSKAFQHQPLPHRPPPHQSFLHQCFAGSLWIMSLPRSVSRPRPACFAPHAPTVPITPAVSFPPSRPQAISSPPPTSYLLLPSPKLRHTHFSLATPFQWRHIPLNPPTFFLRAHPISPPVFPRSLVSALPLGLSFSFSCLPFLFHVPTLSASHFRPPEAFTPLCNHPPLPVSLTGMERRGLIAQHSSFIYPLP